MVEYSHTDIAHTDFIDVGKAKTNPDITRLVHIREIEFASHISRRLIHVEEYVTKKFVFHHITRAAAPIIPASLPNEAGTTSISG